MENRIKILSLLSELNIMEEKIENIVYGSVEVREREGKRYIYVHNKNDGISSTKYVGEYSDELLDKILSNTERVKEIKKQIKIVKKQLKEIGYVETDISSNVANNIDFARRHLVDSIYKQAVLEGIATTYADTETIIEGGKINNMDVNDVLKVINLKHAWEFILNKDVINSPTNFALLCEINKLVEEGFYYNAGRVRSTPVSIGGTTWKPEIPIEGVVREELNQILNSDLEIVDKAIEVLLFTMKKQIFIDGNKRTAVIFANHLLISNAKGLIVIPNDKVEEYRALLIDYYESKDEKTIKEFLKTYAYRAI